MQTHQHIAISDGTICKRRVLATSIRRQLHSTGRRQLILFTKPNPNRTPTRLHLHNSVTADIVKAASLDVPAHMRETRT
eukprot:3438758-Pyramimonas_sp.AAC.3